MSTHNDTDDDRNDTVLGRPPSRYDNGTDEKRPNGGQTIYNIFLGTVSETR